MPQRAVRPSRTNQGRSEVARAGGRDIEVYNFKARIQSTDTVSQPHNTSVILTVSILLLCSKNEVLLSQIINKY